MSPELYFAATLAVRMAVTAAFVVAATVTAERAGPLIGGLVATLPLGAGPVYVFLALDHGASFIALSALNSLGINSVNVTFALIYAVLAQKRSLPVSLSVALAVWMVLAWIVHEIHWSVPLGVAVNVVVIGSCILMSRPLRHVPIPPVRTYWYDLVMRAGLVALLVALTVSLSFTIGPAGSGILAVFPIILIGIQIILHRRVGGPPTAAVMAHGIVGLIGFACACVVLHYTAVPFGAAVGLTLALATSVTWSLIVFYARRRGIAL